MTYNSARSTELLSLSLPVHSWITTFLSVAQNAASVRDPSVKKLFFQGKKIYFSNCKTLLLLCTNFPTGDFNRFTRYEVP